MPTQVPEVLYAGTTWSWTRDLAEFPASEGHTLVYKFVSADTVISATATTTTTYTVSVSATTTANYIPGRYEWTAYVTLSGAVHVAETGWVDLKANPATVRATDNRSHARKVLESLYALKEAHVTGGAIISYSVAGRSVTRGSLAELNRDIVAYEQRVRSEENPGSFGRPVEFAIRAPR